MDNDSIVHMYTDGACKGNPGLGGWGVFLQYNNFIKELYGGTKELTTNNKMELFAVIQGLSSLKKRCNVKIYTDSKYVKDGITKWLDNWKINGWKTTNKKDVKNKELWQQLDSLRLKHNISWNWIKGHSNNFGNDKADQLANLGIKSL